LWTVGDGKETNNTSATVVFQSCWDGSTDCDESACVSPSEASAKFHHAKFCCCVGDECNSKFSFNSTAGAMNYNVWNSNSSWRHGKFFGDRSFRTPSFGTFITLQPTPIALFVLLAVVCATLAIVLAIQLLRHRRLRKKLAVNLELTELVSLNASDRNTNENIEHGVGGSIGKRVDSSRETTDSGLRDELLSSSADVDLLGQLPSCGYDVSDIVLHRLIHHGRYARVYEAGHQPTGRALAVKVYDLGRRGNGSPGHQRSPQQPECLQSELAVFGWIGKLKHPHILEFVGSLQCDSSVSDADSGTGDGASSSAGVSLAVGGRVASPLLQREEWLLTAFMSDGALQHYLKHNVVSWDGMLKMAASLADGLAFLHEENNGPGTFKPRIAHRDLSSRNVLVQPDGSVCISDFGFSMPLVESKLRRLDCDRIKLNEVGTLRYMAPEILNAAVNLNDPPNALLQADVYGLGLVLWEMISRCSELYEGSEPPEYRVPFWQEVAAKDAATQLSQMHEYVCRNKCRPQFPPKLQNAPYSSGNAFYGLKSIVEDCWEHEAEARVLAFCAFERLSSLKEMGQQYPPMMSINGARHSIVGLPSASKTFGPRFGDH
jgi:serine/threonine protein kinase